MRAFKLAFIAAVAAFLVACGGGNEPKDVAIGFEKAMIDGNVKKLMSMINLSDLKEDEKKELNKEIEGKLLQMSARVDKQVKAKNGFDKIEFIEEQITEDKAVVKLKIHFKDGSNIDDRVRLTKVDGKWKVELN